MVEDDWLDTIKVYVKNIPEETMNFVKKDNINGTKKDKFIKAYTLMFLVVIIELLMENNVVNLGRSVLGFSLHTSSKLTKTRQGIINYKTLRVYVHISKSLHKKTRMFYYSHMDSTFKRAWSPLRQLVTFERYPSNYL